LIGKELICIPEEKVRQEYIVHLVNKYGYSLDQMAQEVKVNNSKRGQGKARADIVIWKTKEDRNSDNSPVIVIECKAEQITIHEEDYYQGYNYASWAGADFFVTTNLKDTKFFRVVKGKMPKKLEEVVEIPNAAELFDKKKIEELLTKTKAFTRDEFSKLLFKCHNIIRNNDKLSPEAAFDEISKILFMKIRYEREQAKTKALFSRKEFEELKSAYEKITGKDSLPFYQHFFEKRHIDHFRKRNMFPEHTFNWDNLVAACNDEDFGAKYKDNKSGINKPDYAGFFDPVVDSVQDYFYYNERGEVEPHPTLSDPVLHAKVQKTIAVFNLQDKSLVNRRKTIIEQIKAYAELTKEEIFNAMKFGGFVSLIEQYNS